MRVRINYIAFLHGWNDVIWCLIYIKRKNIRLINNIEDSRIVTIQQALSTSCETTTPKVHARLALKGYIPPALVPHTPVKMLWNFDPVFAGN